jgi:predicted polyphosphate/ATP-dependent NAD kinase
MSGNVKWPFGPADLKAPAAHAATVAVTITNAKTFLTLPTMTGAVTVNLTIDGDLEAGAELILRAKSDGTARDVTPGTGLEGPVVAGVINKTKVARYVYDGSKFVNTALALQID